MDMERMIYPNRAQVQIDVVDHLRKAADFLAVDEESMRNPANVAALMLREMYTGGGTLSDYVGSSLGEYIVETLGLTEARLDWEEEEDVWMVRHHNYGRETLYGAYTSYQEMQDAVTASGVMAVFASDGAWERICRLDLLDNPGAERLRGEALVSRVKEILRGAGAGIREGGRAGELAALAIHRASGQFSYEDLNCEDLYEEDKGV